jgi:uncharacterized protein (DUF1697 family)
MATVVFLRGVNVGGHKTFRPGVVAEQLRHLGAVNIGAAGTFVIRKRVSRTRLRAELARNLPFETEIVMCEGGEVLGLMAESPFARQPERPDIVRFVSVLSDRPRSEPSLPLNLPPTGKWLARILERRDRFVFGEYRRQMKAIGLLGKIDRLFGVPVTSRSWNTMAAIAKVVGVRESSQAED